MLTTAVIKLKDRTIEEKDLLLAEQQLLIRQCQEGQCHNKDNTSVGNRQPHNLRLGLARDRRWLAAEHCGARGDGWRCLLGSGGSAPAAAPCAITDASVSAVDALHVTADMAAPAAA